MEHKRLVANLNGVAGIMSALIARHDVEALSKQIYNLAFAFVSPLSADDDNNLGHEFLRELNSIER